jgi:hypothetical protein
MYNHLKTLVNQVRNLGSTKWDDHEMVKVILRSLVFLNPTQVQLIRGNPRYTLMSPEEVIGNFVSFELMIKGSKKIIELDDPSTPKAQPVAFKATEEKEEESTSSRQPIDTSKLDNEEMSLIIKSFRQILKQRRGKDYKPRSKKVCYKCGKPDHFIAKCPLYSDSVVKDAYALEVEKCERLSSELSKCHDIIINLRNENASLITKVDSKVCDDSISIHRDDNVKLLARIEKLNDSLASLRIENEKNNC